jgi:hypothetical protein
VPIELQVKALQFNLAKIKQSIELIRKYIKQIKLLEMVLLVLYTKLYRK